MAIKRMGQPEDMVGACLFLLSDDAGWLTGQIIAVDGGQTFRCMRVGFIGLGVIGKPMALRLASEFDLRVYDVVPEPVAELVAAGATGRGRWRSR